MGHILGTEDSHSVSLETRSESFYISEIEGELNEHLFLYDDTVEMTYEMFNRLLKVYDENAIFRRKVDSFKNI